MPYFLRGTRNLDLLLIVIHDVAGPTNTIRTGVEIFRLQTPESLAGNDCDGKAPARRRLISAFGNNNHLATWSGALLPKARFPN